MYKCKETNKPLTEYDVMFYKELFPEKSIDEYESFEGLVTLEDRKLLYDQRYGNSEVWFFLLPLFALIPVLALLLVSLTAKVDTVIWLVGTLIPLYILNIVSVVLYNKNNSQAKWDEYVNGTHYIVSLKIDGELKTKDDDEDEEEKSFTGRNNSDIAKTRGEAVSEERIDNSSLTALAVLFPPIYIIAVISIMIQTLVDRKRINNRVANEILSEVVTIYNKVEDETERYNISKLDVDKYVKSLTEYEEEVRKTKKKYAILGEEAVSTAIKRLSFEKPMLTISVSGKEYFILEKKNDISFLMRQNENGKSVGIALYKNKKIYFDSDDWQEEFIQLGMSNALANAIKERNKLSK